MELSRIFILRPVATTLLMLSLLLAGWITYRLLPVSALPQVDYPTLRVFTLYPGASPQVMAATVTAPLERQFGQMPGLTQMISRSATGVSVITLRFTLDLPLDVAEQEVQAALTAANNLLPQDLPAPPVYNKVNPADTPILTLAVTSRTLPLTRIQDLVDNRVAQKLAQVNGVGLVTLSGGQRPAVRIRVNPEALAAYGLTLDDVREGVRKANVNQPKGSFDGEVRISTLDANDQLRSPEEYADLVLSYRDGRALRLRDVAGVDEGAENQRLAAWANAQGAILISVQRQPGANVIDVVERIQAQLPQLQASLPAGLDMQVLTDRTLSIQAAISSVQHELWIAVALVIMVTFLFLRRISATLIPSVTVPLSLIGTFVALYLAGFSLNNLTLMALTIAAGFVVDDAIVMLENIARHLEAGEPPLQAALKGARQIGFTLISLIAVLIPLLFMEDVIGRLFREFAITLAMAILLSLLVSLSLTPMMCARLLKARDGVEHQPQWLNALARTYQVALDLCLRHQPLTLALTLGTLVLTLLLYLAIPKGFFPEQDTGLLQGLTQAPDAVAFPAMAERQQALVQALLEDPAVSSIASSVGVDGQNTTLSNGQLLISLKPHGQRGADLTTILQRLHARADLPGIELTLRPVQDLTVEDSITPGAYQLTLQAPDDDQLQTWVPRLLEGLQGNPALAWVGADLHPAGRQLHLEFDRDAASRLGISIQTLSNALYDALGQRQISTIFTQSSQYRVVLEVQNTDRLGPRILDDLYVRAANGTPVRLSQLAHIEERAQRTLLTRYGQLPAVTLSFDPTPGTSLEDALAAIEATRQRIGLPESFRLQPQGAAAAFQSSLSSTLWLILAAVITMYVVLGVLYESYVHPLTILSTLPSAAIGALLALFITGKPLDLIAIIGIILLIGIVKKNAIMMIDFALEAQRQRGLDPTAAIREAALLRLRPILMTTLAALLGALPLMLASGPGAELRQPLGLTMVGGLLVSQVLTLFTTPVVYLAFDRLSQRLSPPPAAATASP